jgi:hypothetical protein
MEKADIINSIVREKLDSGKAFSFAVSTRSMLPFIKEYDKVVVRKYPLEILRPGDVVVFEREKELFVHRFLRRRVQPGSGVTFLIKGDNSLVADLPVREEELIGKVVCVRRGERTMELDNIFWLALGSIVGIVSYLEWVVYDFLRCIKRRILRR